MMYLKVHETVEGKIVAACDKELVGKVLDDGKYHLDLKASKSFYVGKKATKSDLKNALKDFHSANLVGKNTTDVAVKGGFAQKEDVIYIKEIPHIQIYKI